MHNALLPLTPLFDSAHTPRGLAPKLPDSESEMMP